MRLITAVLLRNEAGTDRYLRRVLSRCREFSDTIVCLDDASTDGTPKVCDDYGAIVKIRSKQDHAWGKESSARAELWELAMTQVQGDDWILICDADQELVGDPRPLMLTRDCNSWAWPLYDMWNEKEYREDAFWRGHLIARAWMVAPNRVPEGWQPEWSPRGVHPGHLPMNYPAMVGLAPPDVFWLHWGWSKEEHRKQKYEQYMKESHQLSPAERAHVESIIQ